MPTTRTVHHINMDWKETPEVHVFKADLPGFRKRHTKVKLIEGKFLEVNAKRHAEEIDASDSWHLMERKTGKFWRKIELPEVFRKDQYKVWQRGGVLKITLTKEKDDQIESCS